MGADDFIRKPFSQRLLVERVKAVLRRSSPKDGSIPKEADSKVLERGQLRMDQDCNAELRTGPRWSRRSRVDFKGEAFLIVPG